MKKIFALLCFALISNITYSQNSACFNSLNDYSLAFPQDKPFSTNVGDINGDGNKDVVFTTFSNKVIALMGSSSGNFSQGYTVNVVSSPRRSVLKDINGDGFSDLVVLHTNNYCVSVLLGVGTGSFVHTGTISVVTQTPSLQIRDLKIEDVNNDGFQDICVSSSNGNPSINVLLGIGNGTFMPFVSYNTQIGNSSSIELVDINNDGNIDVIGTSYLAQAVVHYGNGSGAFSTFTTIPGVGFGNDITVGDFNNDTFLDFAFLAQQSNLICFYFNNGAGTFTTQVLNGIVDSPYSLSSGNLNGDANRDLVVIAEGSIQTYFGNGNGTFTPNEYIALGLYSDQGGQTIKLSDFNNDGFLDIVCTTSANDERIYFLKNNGQGVFKGLPAIKFPTSQSYNGGGLCVADLNSDGFKDLIIGGPNGLGISLGASNSVFLTPITYSANGNGYLHSPVCADLNGDNNLDVVTVGGFTNKVVVSFGDGLGSFNSTYTLSSGTGVSDARLGDINNDGFLDLAVGCMGSSDIYFYLGGANGVFTQTTVVSILADFVNLDLKDVNNDGNLDILYTRLNNSLIYVLTGNGNFTFASPVTYPSGGTGPGTFDVKDINNDGYLDVLIANQGVNKVGVLLGTNSGTFLPVSTFTTGNGPRNIIIGDLNNDGNQDVVTANYGSLDYSVLLGNGTGSLSAPTHFPVGRLTNSSRVLQLEDVNNDGTLDVLIRSYINVNFSLGRNNVVISHNNTAFISSSATSNTICAGSPIVLSANQNAFNYSWSPIASNLSSITVTNSGVYTVTLTSQFGGCSSVASKTVYANPSPTLSVSGNQTLCTGGSSTLTASGANTYTWLPGNVNASVNVVTPTVTTTYTVEGTNSFLCKSNSSIQLIVSPCTKLYEVSEGVNSQVVIYPNPNNGHFNLKINQSGTYYLMDQTGKVILELLIKEEDPQTQIINGLAKGIYFLKGKDTVKKIVVL